jgi:hypothetical protein
MRATLSFLQKLLRIEPAVQFNYFRDNFLPFMTAPSLSLDWPPCPFQYTSGMNVLPFNVAWSSYLCLFDRLGSLILFEGISL